MRQLKRRLKDAEARARQTQPDLDDKEREIKVNNVYTLSTNIIHAIIIHVCKITLLYPFLSLCQVNVNRSLL